MAESGGSRSPEGGTEDDKDNIAKIAGDVKGITQSTQSGLQEGGKKTDQANQKPRGVASRERRKLPNTPGEDGEPTDAFQKEEEKKFTHNPGNKNASPKTASRKYVSDKRSNFEKTSSNSTDLKNYEQVSKSQGQKTFMGKEVQITSEKGLVREQGKTDAAPDKLKTARDAFGNQSDEMDDSFVLVKKQDVPNLTNQNPGEKNREETTKNTEAALKEEESAQKHSEGQNKCKSNFDTASPKPSERNDSHDIVMKKNILDEPTGGQLSPAGSDGGTNQEDATVSDEEGTQYFMNNLREDGSNIEGEEEGADNLKGVLTLSERKETDAETKEIIRGTDTTDVATSEAVEDAGSWKGIATSGGQNKTETKTEEISKETDATDDASSEAEHEDSLEQTDKSEEQKETETLAEHNNDRETDISDVDGAPTKTAEHVGRFEGTVTSSRQRVTQETQAGESHKSLEINEHSLSETGQVDHVEDSETSSVLKEKEMQPDPSCSETVNKNHVHSEGSSSSIEQLAHGPDSDKEGTEIEGGELQFQMSSMTHLPENAESSQKCDKTLAFQEQHSELHSNDTRDTDKPGNSSGEAVESNTCEPRDLKKTKPGGSDKSSMPAKNYYLKKVGHGYCLGSKSQVPVKVDMLKGETDVSVEENFILINGEAKYYFTDEEGDITVHEIGEAKSGRNSNISGKKESATGFEKNEEKLSTEFGEKSDSNFEESATSSQSDELLRGSNNQSSQTADSPLDGGVDACTHLMSRLKLGDSETNSEDSSEPTQTQTGDFLGRSGRKDTGKAPKPAPRKPTHGDGREPCQGQSSQPVPPPRHSKESDKHQSLHGNELKSEGQDQPVEETKTGKQDKKADNLVLQQPDVSGRNVSKEERSSDGRETCQGQSSSPVAPPRLSKVNAEHQNLHGNELKSEVKGKQSRSFDIPVWLFHGGKRQFLHVRPRSHSDHVKVLYLLQNEKALKLLNEKMKNYGVQVRENQIEVSVKEEEGNKHDSDRIIQNHFDLMVNNIPNLYSEEMKLENDGCNIMQVMMNTDLAKEKLLYAHYFQEQKIFVFVCQEDVKEQAKQCLKALKHRNLDPEHIYERKFPVNIAFKVVFDTCNVKQQISERFPGVSFSYEIDGKDKICQWYLKGPDEKGLEETASFLEEVLEEHPLSSVPFSDIIKNRKIDKETFKTVLSNELKCFIETGAIDTFDIDIEMERVTVVGQSQKEVDTVQSNLRKLLKEFEIDLPSEVCSNLLSEIKLEDTDRVSMVSFGNKCCCIGRSEVIKMLKEKCQTYIKEKKKKDEEESKFSLKPYLVTEDSGGKPENKRSRTVEIKDLNVFKILKNKLCKEQGSVEIIPTEKNWKHGFLIQAYDDKSLFAAEQNIWQLQSDITDKLLSLKFPESKENEFFSLKSSVEDGCSVVIKVKSKDYMSPEGTTVRVSLGNAEHCWENLLVKVIQEEGKPTLEKHDGKMLTQLYVPVWNMEPGEADGTHALQKSAHSILKLVKSDEITHVCLPVNQRHGWPLKKFTKQILKALKSYMKNSHLFPVVFELCSEDIGEFRQCQQIMNETLEEYDPDSDTCEEKQDMCRESKQSRSVQACVVSGKLHEFQADVLVNTTSDTLDLRAGAVSKSLLNTAGKELQKECKERYQGGIKAGEIAVTSGYKLNCKNVFHGSVAEYKKETERECLQEFENFMTACLDEALKRGYTSIAFPAIGTGNLKYPTEKVAETMFKSVKSFADKQNADRSERKLAVYFVIYPTENKHIFHMHEEKYFKDVKTPTRVVPPTSRSAGITVSNVRVSARIASTKSCRNSEAIIYFWDISKLYSVTKEDRFLKETAIGPDFFKKRDSLAGPFVTGAGAFGSGKILHIPLKNAGDRLLEGFKESILFADKEGCSSATFLFKLQSPFMIYQEKLSEALIMAVKDVAEKLNHLKHITLNFEEGLNAEKLFQPFGRDKKSKEKANTTDERFTCVDLSVNGLPDDIDKAEQMLKKWSKSSETQVLSKATSPSDLQRRVHVQEPEPQTIERRENDSPGFTGMQLAGKTILMRNPSLQAYVKISNIPESYSYNQLSGKLLSGSLPAALKKLIYLTGMTEALGIFSSAEDASHVSGYKGLHPLEFSCFGSQGLTNFKLTVTNQELQKLNIQRKDKTFLEDLEKLDAKISEGTSGLNVCVETSYQMKCVKSLKNIFLDGPGAEDITAAEEDDYEHIDLSIVNVEGVTDQMWQLLQEEKKEKIKEFKKCGGTITHNGNLLTLRRQEVLAGDDIMIKDYVSVFSSFVQQMKDMDFVEISSADEHVANIPMWKSEIEDKFNKRCCTFLEEQKKIIVYSDSYEEMKQVEHLFLVKLGKLKETGRKKKVATAEEKSGPASLQSDYKKNQIVFEWKRDARNVKAYKTEEGLQVYVYEANILNLPVDCIVNAANDTLQHGGGVAQVIAKAAGHELTKEGDTYIGKKGRIPVGCVVATNAGILPYKSVIHAVGPRWTDYKKTDNCIGECEKDLFNAIYNSCVEADRKGFQSIAFPAISSAIFGVPGDLCVSQYVKATLTISKTKLASLKEIHFIDKNSDIVKQIQREFKTVLVDGKESPYQRQLYVKGNRRNRTERRKSSDQAVPFSYQKYGHEVPENPRTVPTIQNKGAYFFEENGTVVYVLGKDETKRLLVYNGDLLEVKSAAIVVTVDEIGTGGVLAKGVASKIQEVKMLDIYQKELKRQLSRKPSVGQIAITKGYTTHFSHVFHIIFPFAERLKQPEERRKCLTETYKNVFSAAMKEKTLNIVATALVGIDGKKIEDIDLACSALWDAYLWHLQKLETESISPLDVHLVCLDENQLKRVRSNFNSYIEMIQNTEPDHQTSMKLQHNTEMSKDQDCVICMEQSKNPKVLRCGHVFCTACIDKYFEIKKACPTCGAVCGIITGDQPQGDMKYYFSPHHHCTGYERCGQIIITYTFSSGRQEETHPNPGVWYEGITRTAYLPDNEEGRKILKMLIVAFHRKLVFTIGRSRTTGKEGVITWNDIHHKTDWRSYSQFGYPDETYLQRVTEELAAKGVTEKDIVDITL